MSCSSSARGVAHANIALVKYWGKRDLRLNLPCTGSLSLTLSPLTTETSVHFDPNLSHDTLILNGAKADTRATQRVSALLDLMRAEAGTKDLAKVTSHNNFPTAAGLASSASAFAALVVAADAALNLDASPAQLSVWARRGSGSAARSIFGGFCEMDPGKLPDGSDGHAHPLFTENHWALSVVIGVVEQRAKTVASTDGMELTSKTSPFFQAWCDHVPPDLAAARAAISTRDFQALGDVAERSCLRMHASAMAANPGVLYWYGATVDIIHAVRSWRAEGLGVFFTIDAGPNVKVFCAPSDTAEVSRRLMTLPGVKDTIVCGVGAGAHATREGS